MFSAEPNGIDLPHQFVRQTKIPVCVCRITEAAKLRHACGAYDGIHLSHALHQALQRSHIRYVYRVRLAGSRSLDDFIVCF